MTPKLPPTPGLWLAVALKLLHHSGGTANLIDSEAYRAAETFYFAAEFAFVWLTVKFIFDGLPALARGLIGTGLHLRRCHRSTVRRWHAIRITLVVWVRTCGRLISKGLHGIAVLLDRSVDPDRP
jgi:hypothetical protein